MPLTSEEQKLILNIVGKADIRDLNEELQREQRNVIALTELLRTGGIQQDAYNLTVSASAQNIKRLEGGMAALQSSTRDYRQNLTALGYAVNDFASVSGNLSQRLNGIANNLPMLLQGIGPAGLGLALSGLVPILGIVIQNWEHLSGLLGGTKAIDAAATALDKLRDHIKELEKTPVKLGVDHLDLDNAKKELDKLQADLASFRTFEESRSARQRQSAAAVQSVIDESKGPVVGQKLRASALNQLTSTDTQLNELNAKASQADRDAEEASKTAETLRNAGQFGAASQSERGASNLRSEAAKARADAQGRRLALEKDAEVVVGEARSAASKGDPSKLAQQLRDSGQGALADRIAQSSPESLKAQDELRGKIAQTFTPAMGKAGDFLNRRRANAKMRAMAEETAAKGRTINNVPEEAPDGRTFKDFQSSPNDPITRRVQEARNRRQIEARRKAAARVLPKFKRAEQKAVIEGRATKGPEAGQGLRAPVPTVDGTTGQAVNLGQLAATNGKESAITAQAKYFAQVQAENQRLQAELQNLTRQFGAAANQLRNQGNLNRNDGNRLIPNTW